VKLLFVIIVLATPVASLAGITVGANQLSVVHKSPNGVTIAFPDVCKTPSPGGPVPIPYPNIAKSVDTSKGSKSTKRNAASYSLSGKGNAKLTIRQTAGKDSVTKATYVDGKGKMLPLREPALVELANGELCGVCATKDGTVTAVYRLLPGKPKLRKK